LFLADFSDAGLLRFREHLASFAVGAGIPLFATYLCMVCITMQLIFKLCMIKCLRSSLQEFPC
jgi:hypothetical protein